MFVGRVIGTVWSIVKWPQVQGLKLLLVRPYHLADLVDLTDPTATPLSGDRSPQPATGEPLAAAAVRAGDQAPSPRGGPDCEAVVCVDLLDAGVGDDVVVAFGHAARVAAQSAGDADASFSPGAKPRSAASASGPATSLGHGPAIVPIDAAIVAIVDRIAVARPST